MATVIPIQKQKPELEPQVILTINGGSSSIKFALYQTKGSLTRVLEGKVDRIGLSGTTLTFQDLVRNRSDSRSIEASDPRSAAALVIDWLEEKTGLAAVNAVGHRVVHGMHYTGPQLVTPELLEELHRISPYDPDHLPTDIELIEVVRRRYPQALQVACFDTSFHHTMPRVARLLSIPRRFDAMGIQRYGFHGLSYTYLMEELARVAGTAAVQGRVILGHLGSGASLAAVRGGKSIDTTMGFTPAAGLPMGTRTGDLDPGVAWYLMRSANLTPEQFNHIVNHESGLLGVSETSSDMRDLIQQQSSDIRAAEAIDLFCYQTRKSIGALAAALGGLETLVFAGGIGENAAEVRARICAGLQFLGIDVDKARNAVNAPVISTASSRATVRVIRTDEELMIARAVHRFLPEQIECRQERLALP
jgi:acetate kinase